MTPLLEARRITKIFRHGVSARAAAPALEDFSLAIGVEQPAITGIVGESGSGKTTMARLLLGLGLPSRGDVLYLGRDLRRLTRAQRHAFRRDVQAVFQDPFEVYNPFYKIDHVLSVPLAKFRLAASRQAGQAVIEAALRQVGLRPEETLGHYPHQLSGGQRQRIMVARALIVKPRLIVADEPVSMIDASLRATVLDNLRQLNESLGISLVYITHDLTTAYQISHNVIVLFRGSVAEAGDVELVVKEPQHPYTQLLIGSIPLPDPRLRWSDQALAPAVNATPMDAQGCRFAARCPHAYTPCLERAPPLYRTSEHRVVACHLHGNNPTMPPEGMSSVFVRPSVPQGAPAGRVSGTGPQNAPAGTREENQTGKGGDET